MAGQPGRCSSEPCFWVFKFCLSEMTGQRLQCQWQRNTCGNSLTNRQTDRQKYNIRFIAFAILIKYVLQSAKYILNVE